MTDVSPQCNHHAIVIDRANRLRGVCAGCGMPMYRPNGLSQWEVVTPPTPRYVRVEQVMLSMESHLRGSSAPITDAQLDIWTDGLNKARQER